MKKRLGIMVLCMIPIIFLFEKAKSEILEAYFIESTPWVYRIEKMNDGTHVESLETSYTSNTKTGASIIIFNSEKSICPKNVCNDGFNFSISFKDYRISGLGIKIEIGSNEFLEQDSIVRIDKKMYNLMSTNSNMRIIGSTDIGEEVFDVDITGFEKAFKNFKFWDGINKVYPN